LYGKAGNTAELKLAFEIDNDVNGVGGKLRRSDGVRSRADRRRHDAEALTGDGGSGGALSVHHAVFSNHPFNDYGPSTPSDEAVQSWRTP